MLKTFNKIIKRGSSCLKVQNTVALEVIYKEYVYHEMFGRTELRRRKKKEK